MAADYGSDVSTVGELDPMMRLQTGRQIVAWALARRLMTRRGSMLRDSHYGFDVRDYVQRKMTPSARMALAGGVRAEALKDRKSTRLNSSH